ncbi:1-acyl-sn-glycerol-3-phosphate acyltransferase [Marivivens niveibacter]|uniref:1-acyl-sn-glycerol-3-phosphate acyltransferase n=1 Tax=Marivivens niveibacter TaxID=1930667 RepID=A0A251X392_9RHOB|nr:lysophospholipid acyltransferase family protein [Marivivens niveibacter]OUD10865.1 1-acyl-sn-glycerol-3-phosphate acyltransferase [Marivivens niveibacter]
MNMMWDPDMPPPSIERGPFGYVKALFRAIGMLVVILLGLCVFLPLRLIEMPIFGAARPMSPYVTQFVCRNTLRIVGIKYSVKGQPMKTSGAVVANHASWLDIFVLNARKRIYFVAKSEVAGWAGIGFLARITGTVFIKRDRKEASNQINVFRDRLALGHKLLFFPEGTSTDGRRVLLFKPTLFAAFLTPEIRDEMKIQPVSIVYQAGPNMAPRQYGWWGDMAFGTHLIATLAARRQGRVTVVYHPAVNASDYTDRKVLARDLENTVRSSLEEFGVLDE